MALLLLNKMHLYIEVMDFDWFWSSLILSAGTSSDESYHFSLHLSFSKLFTDILHGDTILTF